MFLNDEKTRTFLALAAGGSHHGGSSTDSDSDSDSDSGGGGAGAGAHGRRRRYCPQLVALSHAVSGVFAAHGLPRFYDDPRPHVSGVYGNGNAMAASRLGGLPAGCWCCQAGAGKASSRIPFFACKTRHLLAAPPLPPLPPALQSPGCWASSGSSWRRRWPAQKCRQRQSGWRRTPGGCAPPRWSARRGSGSTWSGRQRRPRPAGSQRRLELLHTPVALSGIFYIP